VDRFNKHNKMKNKKAANRFLPKCKKGQMEEFIKVALWVLFFILAATGAYYLVKSLTNI